MADLGERIDRCVQKYKTRDGDGTLSSDEETAYRKCLATGMKDAGFRLEEVESADSRPARALQAKTNARAKLRAGPDISFGIVGELPSNASVYVRSCNSGWCKIDFQGGPAFVSEELLDPTTSTVVDISPSNFENAAADSWTKSDAVPCGVETVAVAPDGSIISPNGSNVGPVEDGDGQFTRPPTQHNSSNIEGSATTSADRKSQLRSTLCDWQFRCDTPTAMQSEQCVLMQFVTATDRENVGLTVILLESITTQTRIMRVLAPLGMLLPSGLGLNIDGVDVGRAGFVRCLPSGCVVEVILEDDLLAQLVAGRIATFIIFQTPEEGMGIPISLDGLASQIEKL